MGLSDQVFSGSNVSFGAEVDAPASPAKGDEYICTDTTPAKLLVCQVDGIWSDPVSRGLTGGTAPLDAYGNVLGLSNLVKLVPHSTSRTIGLYNAEDSEYVFEVMQESSRTYSAYVRKADTRTLLLSEADYNQPSGVAGLNASARISGAQAPLMVATELTGSGNWTVPSGVTQIKVTCVGGGGAGATQGTTNAPSGGNTTFSTVTALGGDGGQWNVAHASDGYDGYVSGNGGRPSDPTADDFGTAGLGGQIVIKTLTVTPGATLAYSVGAGGVAVVNGSYAGGDGGNGTIIIEYFQS